MIDDLQGPNGQFVRLQKQVMELAKRLEEAEAWIAREKANRADALSKVWLPNSMVSTMWPDDLKAYRERQAQEKARFLANQLPEQLSTTRDE